MYSPKSQKVRKILFDIFKEMTQYDVEAANFFIRNESRVKCKDIFELMDILEKLAYFNVSKVQFERLIELLENINRFDLQKRLQAYAEELCCNNNGNDFTIAPVLLNWDEHKRKTSDSSEEANLEGQDVEDPSVSVASNLAEGGIGNSNPQLQDYTEVDDLEMDFIKLAVGPDPSVTETTIKQQFTSKNSSIKQECNSYETPIESKASSSSEITLYNYQNELGEKGKTGVNSIICSPTGSGKTITAASIIKYHLEVAKQRDHPYRVLYLVHIRYLVKHLSIDLKRILKDEVYPLENDDLLCSEIVRDKAVVILTAKILDNALNSESVSLSDYDLLVFDECHNTVLKHPYNEIMKKYHDMKRRKKRVPQVLGLSATLGGGSDPFKAIVNLCANMHTPWVSCVRDENNLKELLEKNKAPLIDESIPCQSRLPDEFCKTILSVMQKYIIDLETDHSIQFGDSYQAGKQEFESFLAQLKNNCEKQKLRVEVRIIDFLIIMNKALIYYNDLIALNATEYLREKLPKPDSSDLDIEKEIISVYEDVIENLKDFALKDKLENNEKLLKLKNLLKEIFETNPETKVILLCLTRFNAIQLKELIMSDQELKKFVKTDYIIGQSGDNGLTQNQQANVLKRFQDNELNLLLATSIAEQGLNIPDCEIVIRYQYVTSDISRRQAQGRARKENSKCYLIADENTNNIYRDYRNKLLEKEMDAALVKVTEMGEESFKETVLETIRELHYLAELMERNAHLYEYKIQSDKMNILCKDCHQILCCGSDILKKGSDYICMNPDFESKVNCISRQEQDFRHDSNIGISRCNGEQCKNKFGAIKKYKRGQRLYGFVLNVKSILFQIEGNPLTSQLKKWSQHSFQIKEEAL